MSRTNLLVVGAAVVLLMPLGCKKKPIAPTDVPVPVQRVESRLQVTSLSPSAFQAGVGGDATVYGSGFEEGVTVTIGTKSIEAHWIDPNTVSVVIPAMTSGTYDVKVSVNDESAVLRNGLTVRGDAVASGDCQSSVVYFGFDSAGLSADGRRLLDGYMPCFQSRTGQIRLGGHADERGTTDYNLALGQRRADTVATHLRTHGVSSQRLKVTSYGEERPAAQGSNETAWGKNRRVEVSAD